MFRRAWPSLDAAIWLVEDCALSSLVESVASPLMRLSSPGYDQVNSVAHVDCDQEV